DYFATGKLAPEVAAETISGIANGCLKTGTAFIGGETAEMPDFYRPGEYDLAGFIVGVVARDELIDGGAIMAGDRLLGLSSSGLHTNGYSLARRAIFDSAGRKHDEHIPELESTISEALLEIHTCYLGAISEVQSLSGRGWATGMAHITGGGIAGNLSRIIPDGLQAQVSRSSWKTPAVFEFIKQCGKLDEAEMYRAFNMGIGYIVVCRPDRFDEINRIILRHGHQTFELGEVVTTKVVTAPKVTLH
ncbi:MAG: phosphoribosylformylglycinamidine cyclo-ligase, partial [Candidatus Zixiibacteriota bacterium]